MLVRLALHHNCKTFYPLYFSMVLTKILIHVCKSKRTKHLMFTSIVKIVAVIDYS